MLEEAALDVDRRGAARCRVKSQLEGSVTASATLTNAIRVSDTLFALVRLTPSLVVF